MFDREQHYSPADAIKILKQMPAAKFDETVEVAVRLGIDPRKADQMVRGTVSLPHGTGKDLRVAAFAQGDKAREATEAGADLVGGEDLVAEVQKGNIEFDAAVATPDMMSVVGKAGRVLGPRGLMPNPKAGTVSRGHRQGGPGHQGREARVPRGSPGEQSPDHREALVRRAAAARELPGDHGRADPGQAGGRQGPVPPEHHPLHHDGARASRSTPAAPRTPKPPPS